MEKSKKFLGMLFVIVVVIGIAINSDIFKMNEEPITKKENIYASMYEGISDPKNVLFPNEYREYDLMYDVTNVKERFKYSEVVIDAEPIEKLEVVFDKDAGVLYTKYKMLVEEDYKGELKQKEVIVYIPGGIIKVEDYIVQVGKETYQQTIENQLVKKDMDSVFALNYGFNLNSKENDYIYFAYYKDNSEELVIPDMQYYISAHDGESITSLENNKVEGNISDLK